MVRDLEFEWDDEKARANLVKHGISFQEAKTVLGDPLALSFADSMHSEAEVRYTTLGLSDRNRLLIVVHTVRKSRVRLISSRAATNAERREYENES